LFQGGFSMLRLAAIIIFFSSTNDVALAQSSQVSNVSFMEMAACVSEVSTRPAQGMTVGMTDTRLF
jgi:hypothetical protein